MAESNGQPGRDDVDAQPGDAHHAHVPGPTSYEQKQGDIGASLVLGGVVLIVLLGVLIWQGLF